MEAVAQPREPQITVAATIVAEPASLIPLPIQIGPPQVVPRNSFIRLRGMPPTVSLTEGYAIGPGLWAIPLIGLPTLKANVPVGISGRAELTISLIAVDGALLAETKTALVVQAAAVMAPLERVPQVQMPTSALKPSQPLPPTVSSRRILVAPRVPELSPEQRSSAEKLVAQGKQYLQQGNIAVARQFFRLAANAGLAEGATRLADTYDANELARLGVQGVVADPAEARKWYDRARELGAPEADGASAQPGADQRQGGQSRQ